jgi:peptidylprolyl isomerase
MAIIALCGALVLGGCGGADSATSDSAGSQIPVQSGEEAAERAKPEVTVPPAPPPKGQVVVNDLIEGSGEEAHLGDKVTILYVGISWNGDPYADSWVYPSPPTLPLGKSFIELGVDEGIRGMKVGGRREMLIPNTRILNADEQGRPHPRPVESLVYVVDLLGVESQS